MSFINFLAFFIVLTVRMSIAGMIAGKVTSAETGKPLHGANVYVAGTSFGAATISDGSFQIDNLASGAYTLKTSFMGYQNHSQKVKVQNNSSIRVHIKLFESVINMDAVLVTATRTEKALKDVPALTQVITHRQLQTTGAMTVQEALDELPALDFAPDRHGPNISMHGLGPKYVLFLIDGERMAGEVKGNIDFSRLNTADIERIEIVKGASSSLYGSNAIAGVVNIITRDVQKALELETHTRASKYNELSLGGSVGFRRKWMSSKTTITHKSSDGYDLHPASINRTIEEYNDLSVKQTFTYTPREKLTIRAGGGYFVREKLEARRTLRNKYPKYYDLSMNIGAEYKLNPRLDLEASWYYDNYDTKDVMMLLDEERRTYQNLNNTGRILTRYSISNDHMLITGFELMWDKVFSTRIFGENHKAQDRTLFMQDDIQLGTKWKTVPGFRLNNHSEYGTHFTPSLSLMFQALPINLRATYARGFKSPTLKELYFNWDHGGGGPYVYGNPDLKPETSDYVSVSAEYIASRVNGSISLFHTDLRDMIDSRPERGDPNVNYYGNVAKAMTQGIEALLKLDIGRGFVFSGGYSFVDTEDKTTGRPLYGRALHSGSTILEYRNPSIGFFANMRAKFVGQKNWGEETDKQTGEIITYKQNPHTIWRFTATKNILSYFRFMVGIDNIFDYRDIDYLITPGRVIYIGLNIHYN